MIEFGQLTDSYMVVHGVKRLAQVQEEIVYRETVYIRYGNRRAIESSPTPCLHKTSAIIYYIHLPALSFLAQRDFKLEL